MTWHVHPADHVPHCTRCGMRLDDMPYGDVLTQDTDLATCLPTGHRQVEPSGAPTTRQGARETP